MVTFQNFKNSLFFLIRCFLLSIIYRIYSLTVPWDIRGSPVPRIHVIPHSTIINTTFNI